MHQVLFVPLLLYLITVPNMNKTHSFWRYHNKYKIQDKYLHSYLYFTCISNKWYVISVPNMNKITTFFWELSQQKLKKYETIAIITQIWNRAKFYFTCISGPSYLIMIPNMTKIYQAIIEECVRRDWRTGPFPIFSYSTLHRVRNNNSFQRVIYHTCVQRHSYEVEYLIADGYFLKMKIICCFIL